MPVKLTGVVMPTGSKHCPFCGRSFWLRRDLEDHIRNDHKLGPQIFNK